MSSFPSPSHRGPRRQLAAELGHLDRAAASSFELIGTLLADAEHSAYVGSGVPLRAQLAHDSPAPCRRPCLHLSSLLVILFSGAPLGQRAQKAQSARIEAVRVLAEARQAVTDVRERFAHELRTAEDGDAKAYLAAVRAGWSSDELRKIGFDEPEKKRRTRRKTATDEHPEATL